MNEKYGFYAGALLDSAKGLWRNLRACDHGDHSHPLIHLIKFSNGESDWLGNHLPPKT